MNGFVWKLIGILIVAAIPFVLGVMVGGSWATGMECDCDQEQVEEEVSEETSSEDGD